jgi:hypothetical protein
VDKLQYAFTGPWQVTAALFGASYSLEHCGHKGCTNKKHASDLSPYLPELVPFTPLDGADTRYGQLYKPISNHPFKEARIKGFTPCQAYQVIANHLAIVGWPGNFHWPSLLELNNDIAPSHWESDEEFKRYTAVASIDPLPVMATGLT